MRLTHLQMDAYQEHGSELALVIDRASGIANISIAFNAQNSGNWAISPAVHIGYEHGFGAASVRTHGHLYGYSVRQEPAFNHRDTASIGANVSVAHGPLSLTLSGQAEAEHRGDSHGYSGNLAVAYSF